MDIKNNNEFTSYPSINKPWLKYYNQEAQAVMPPASTLYEQLWQNNQNYLGDTALIYYGKKKSSGKRDVEQMKSCRTGFCLPDGAVLRAMLF